MKIFTAAILCLIVLMTGCSSTGDRTMSPWIEQQMEEDRRIHGDTHESGHTWEGIERNRD